MRDNIHVDAKILTKQAKTIHINLPRDVNIQKIFTTLYSDGATEGENLAYFSSFAAIEYPTSSFA